MLEPIKYSIPIRINDIPSQWIPRFELYYPDLPQYPIVYVHTVLGDTRVYGFPISAAPEMKGKRKCDIELQFLCNKDLNSNHDLFEVVKGNLEGRFGVSDKVTLDDVVSFCNGNRDYERFFTKLWEFVSETYGECIPYGKFYEELYSIVRFVSAWNPKTGRQSEMRMLYNFISTFGERIEVAREESYLEFFLLPTYSDVINGNLSEFPKFQTLHLAMEKIWDVYFTEETKLDATIIRSMKSAWTIKKDDFIKEVTKPLQEKKILTIENRYNFERLVDAFNRHSWRAAFFTWSIMTAMDNDYTGWTKDYFVKFYSSNCGVGVAEKVVSCFLQQGFKNDEVIPIDTWVKAFYEHALGIGKRGDFFSSFSKLGKLERVIWLSSQARKVNISGFFDILWCIRYGDTGNKELRGPNPISCYECKLRDACPGYSRIKNFKVLIEEESSVVIKGQEISSPSVIKKAVGGACVFVCLTENAVPKKIFLNKRGWKLIDEFSGYLLKTEKTSHVGDIVTVQRLVDSLPSTPSYFVE